MLSAYLKDNFKVKLDVTPIEQEEEIDIEDHGPAKQFEDNLMSKGYLIYSADECYGKQLTRNSYVFIQKVKENGPLWTGYRITYDKDNNIRNDKTIIQDINFMKVLERMSRYTENYLDFISSN